MKNMGTLSPALGVSDTTVNLPAAAMGFTSTGRTHAAALAAGLVLAAALADAGAATTLALVCTACADDGAAGLAGAVADPHAASAMDSSTAAAAHTFRIESLIRCLPI